MTRQHKGLSRALRDRDSGLSLAEMVVTLGIITVVLLAAGGAFVRSTQAQRVAEGTDRATQLANDAIESFRRVPWSKVGFYQDQPDRRNCATASAGCKHQETTVFVGANAPTFPASDPNPPFVPTPRRVNNDVLQPFTIRTDITWARIQFSPTASDHNNNTDGLLNPGAPYAPKRIRVEVSWTLGGVTRTTVSETIRTASAAEVVPPRVGVGQGTGCSLAAPFCVAYATEGQVLQNGAGFRTSKPVQFFLSLTQQATSASVTYHGTTVAMSSADGRTWSYLIPQNNTGLRPGITNVRFRAVVGASTVTRDIPVSWTMPVSTGTPLTVVYRGLARSGSLLSANGLCVNYNNGQLYDATTFVFDVQNVDDQDATPRVPPSVTWTSPTVGPINATEATILGLPLLASGSTTPGTLNTKRYVITWPAGSLFTRGSTVVTATAYRPADAQHATLIQELPVRWANSRADCATGSSPAKTFPGTT